MTWFPALGWPAWLALAIPPIAIVLLYFLKIRRQTLEVPSTLLWTETIEEFNVNSLWQRFRLQWLLLLQLLAVALIVLASLRPGCQGTQLEGNRFVLLVDHSASMAATDVAPSRLERAKLEAERFIDNMKPGDAAMVISFSDVATVEQSYTTNKTRLKTAVRGLSQVDRYTDLNEALKLATGLSNVGQTSDRESNIDIQVAESLDATAYVFSDGAFPRLPDTLLGKLKLEYVPIGDPQAVRNVGIVGCELVATPKLDGPIQLFVRVANFSAAAERVDLSVEINGELVDAQQGLTLQPEESTPVVLDLTAPASQATLPAIVRVSIGPADHLSADNEAIAILAPADKLQWLVISPSSEVFGKVLSTAKVREIADVRLVDPTWLESGDYAKLVAAEQLDLIIFDQCAPAENPNCNTVYFDRAPPNSAWSLSEPHFPAPIVVTSRHHPLVANLAWDGVLILESRAVTAPTGSTTLVESTFGPMLAIGRRGEFEDLVAGFPLQRMTDDGGSEVNTNWPTRPSFPIFFYNLLAYQTREGARRSNDAVRPGEVVRFPKPAGAIEVQIERPDQQVRTVPVDDAKGIVFEETDQLGLYHLAGGASRRPLFAVNLARAAESDIRTRPAIDVSYQQIVGTPAVRVVQRELWPWLVGLTLILLAVEWIAFIRRLQA